ncbi:MAG: homoserine kinase [SAR116 cluster bacterium]|nr:homoserine kinase [SAR116 cluster bacterium]
MAVYTKVSPDQIEELFRKYDAGNFIKMIEIEEGIENSNYKIITNKNNYILTIYEKRVNEKDLPYFINLMEHLHQNGINCPQPLSDKNGLKLQNIKKKKSLIVSFLSGNAIQNINTEHCYELGRSLANFHIQGLKFNEIRQNDLGYKSWLDLFNKSIKNSKNNNEYNFAKVKNIIVETVNNWPMDLQKGSIHADLFPDNVFFIGNKLSGIIDFYFACYDILAYDLSICINSWCFNENGNFLIERAQSIVTGYESIRKLSIKEKNSLLILSKGAAIRFYLTRLFDWFNTPSNANIKKLNPNDYYEKILFFDSLENLGIR